LERELKTLLLDTGRHDSGRTNALVLAHVRGHRRLSLRAVKHALGVDEARLASVAVLRGLSLDPGTVHPFHPAVHGLKHLVAPEVFALNWVTTNAGELDRYVVFDPAILQRWSITVADLEVQ